MRHDQSWVRDSVSHASLWSKVQPARWGGRGHAAHPLLASLTDWSAAACLLTAATFTVALADGGPWLAVGLPGFIVWVVFVITASVSLLRRRQTP